MELEPEWATDEDEDNPHCEASKNHITFCILKIYNCLFQVRIITSKLLSQNARPLAPGKAPETRTTKTYAYDMDVLHSPQNRCEKYWREAPHFVQN